MQPMQPRPHDVLLTNQDENALLLERVMCWVREVFALEDKTDVIVKQMRCTTPECPPFRTMIYVLCEDRSPYKYKIHKPLAEIMREDVAALLQIQPKIDHSWMGRGAKVAER